MHWSFTVLLVCYTVSDSFRNYINIQFFYQFSQDEIFFVFVSLIGCEREREREREREVNFRVKYISELYIDALKSE